jgi:uncharacterized protein
VESAGAKKEDTVDVIGTHQRIRIYIGEDKRHGDQSLYQAILRKARQLHMAGATVVRGTMGFGRSTRLHTVEVLCSEDLPVIVEIVDTQQKIRDFVMLLAEIDDIGLITSEEVSVMLYVAAHG